jgi:hypothetical protein
MRSLATLSVAAATLALLMAPASAQNWNQSGNWNNGWSGQNQSWNSGGNGRQSWNNDGRSYQRQGSNDGYQGWNNGSGRGWNNRNVSGSDPSFGNRSGLNYARSTGRCVEDLGYGRFEYCGW